MLLFGKHRLHLASLSPKRRYESSRTSVQNVTTEASPGRAP